VKQKISIGLIVLMDLMIVNFSILAAYLIRFDFQIPNDRLSSIPILLVSASVIKITIFTASRLYKSLWRYAGTKEFFFIAFYIFIGNLALLGYGFYYELKIPISIYLIISVLDVVMISSIRIMYRVLRRMVIAGKKPYVNRKNILLYGAGDLGALVINELSHHPNMEYKPVAIIDDDISKHGKKIRGVPIVADRKNLDNVIEKYEINEILISISNVKNEMLNDVYKISNKYNCKVKLMPSLTNIINGKFSISRMREVNIEDVLGRDQINLNNNETYKFLKNKVVMVTGGGGSIGSELCRQIADFEPEKLIVLDNYENNAYDLQNELKRKYKNFNINVVIANVREKYCLKRIFEKYKPDVVFHAAAHKHVPLMEENPTEAVKNNVFGTRNVAEIAAQSRVKRFVMISTDKAVNPTNIMGATKRLAEMVIQGLNSKYDTEFVAVRFGNVLGSNGSVIPLFKQQIKEGGPVTVTHKDVIRYFMTIPEAVQLVLQAGSMAKGGEIFVLDMGKPVRIYDLAKKVIELSGFEPDKDIKIEISGLRPGEKLYEELLLKEEGLRKTENNKIYVAKPTEIDFEVLQNELEKINDVVVNEPGKIREFMKYLVPTYNFENKEKLAKVVYLDKKDLENPVYVN
jgi:FlaA1/EpsC-like NDP-sugar epimerase